MIIIVSGHDRDTRGWFRSEPGAGLFARGQLGLVGPQALASGSTGAGHSQVSLCRRGSRPDLRPGLGLGAIGRGDGRHPRGRIPLRKTPRPVGGWPWILGEALGLEPLERHPWVVLSVTCFRWILKQRDRSVSRFRIFVIPGSPAPCAPVSIRGCVCACMTTRSNTRVFVVAPGSGVTQMVAACGSQATTAAREGGQHGCFHRGPSPTGSPAERPQLGLCTHLDP